jgi:TolB-like protein/Flp pilus assembly protein TadD
VKVVPVSPAKSAPDALFAYQYGGQRGGVVSVGRIAGRLRGSATSAVVLLLTLGAPPLRAQVRGTVSDSAGNPVGGALVELYGAYERVGGQGTDSLGRFSFGAVPASAALLVRAIGFAPVRLALDPADSVVTVTMQPLPVEMTELRVSGAPAWCPPQDDPRAREIWTRAAVHYDIALSAGLIRSWTLVFAADVPVDSLGLMDTTRLRRVFFGDLGTTPRTGWGAFRGPSVPFLESLQAWQFGDPTFAQFNRMAFPPGSAGDTVIAWCSGSEDFPFIRGTLTVAPDTTFATANWEFATPEQPAEAGGRVLFARTDPTVQAQPLLAMAGFYWRKRDRGFFQQWMEFREWTRCESFSSCRTPVRLADRSIAVLTFATAPGDSGTAYLADGLADALSASLGGVGRLKVISRDVVRHTPDVARLTPARLGEALSAANLVDGTIQRAGGRLRITVELIHAASSERLWVMSYDTAAPGLLGVETQIAAGVAGRVVGPLLPGERMLLARRPTADPSAYDHYLRGNRLLELDSGPALAGAIAEYDAALRSDSAFAAAFGRLALAYGKLTSSVRAQTGIAPESTVARGLAAVNRAVAEDSFNADGWLAAGWLLSLRGGPQDLALAPQLLHRAVVFDPGNALGHELFGSALLRMGRFDDAEQELARALELDPRDLDAMADLGLLASSKRSYGMALQWFERLNAVDSTRPEVRILGALARSAVGDAEGAIADARAALAFSPPRDRLRALAVLAGAQARAGDRLAADSLFRRALRDLGGSPGSLPAVLDLRNAWPVAYAAVALGNKELALNVLERVRPRGPSLWDYLILEGFDPIRADPRFQRLLEETRPPGVQDPT